MLIFVVPAIVGIVAQILFYGASYNWSGMMLSILIIYLNIQDNSLNTDYLTGAFNRRLLDRYVKLKILTSTEKKTFSAILVDLKKFKSINDKFGHMIGDEALQESVKLIRSCLRIDDIIARYGGDEFYIILDISDKKLLEETVQRINSSIDRFNNESQKSYKIGFDMGYDVYDYNSKMKSEEFFKHLDRRMYGNKSPE